jgi:hypothetical protein
LLQGVFVLQDNRFRWLTRISVDTVPLTGIQNETTIAANAARASQAAGQYLYFPCGLIRGALTNLGVACAVSAEVATLPACMFFIMKTWRNAFNEDIHEGIDVVYCIA